MSRAARANLRSDSAPDRAQSACSCGGNAFGVSESSLSQAFFARSASYSLVCPRGSFKTSKRHALLRVLGSAGESRGEHCSPGRLLWLARGRDLHHSKGVVQKVREVGRYFAFWRVGQKSQRCDLRLCNAKQPATCRIALKLPTSRSFCFQARVINLVSRCHMPASGQGHAFCLAVTCLFARMLRLAKFTNLCSVAVAKSPARRETQPGFMSRRPRVAVQGPPWIHSQLQSGMG